MLAIATSVAASISFGNWSFPFTESSINCIFSIVSGGSILKTLKNLLWAFLKSPSAWIFVFWAPAKSDFACKTSDAIPDPFFTLDSSWPVDSILLSKASVSESNFFTASIYPRYASTASIIIVILSAWRSSWATV